MSIQDDAYDGSLTIVKLNGYLRTNPGSLDAIGGVIDLTPLCAACLGGHLEVVKRLLASGADPNTPSAHQCTPLFFLTDPTCKANSSTRCAIIRELVSDRNGRKGADIDHPCNDDRNTALMNVILELKDPEVMRQLVASGASLTLTHFSGQRSAKELAEENGLSSQFDTKADKDSAWAKLIDTIVSFVLLIVAYTNSKTMDRVFGGVLKKYYDWSVKESDLPKGLLQDVQPKTVEEFKGLLNEEVQLGKFKKFFSPNDPFLADLAEKANALREDEDTDLGKPENILRLTHLSLYEPVIYCDDSASMNVDDRYRDQIELVARIARIATRIVPDSMNGANLRFINNTFSGGPLTAAEIKETMEKIEPEGYTEIGTTLRSRILKPMVYDAIARPQIVGSALPTGFRRPLLVCVITDGDPNPEDPGRLCDEIVSCKDQLVKAGYDPTCVMFCISQIGTDTAAAAFLDKLRATKDIQDVIYCTAERLDEKYKELKDNHRALESWLLHLLTQPIMTRHLGF